MGTCTIVDVYQYCSKHTVNKWVAGLMGGSGHTCAGVVVPGYEERIRGVGVDG